MKNLLFLDVSMELINEHKYPLTEKKQRGFNSVYFEVNDDNYENIKREKGRYFTVNYNYDSLYKHSKGIIREVKLILNQLLKNYHKSGKTLIIGLGNSSVIADSLGPLTTNKIIATNHYDDFLTIPKVALFTPEVVGKTGISSYDLIKMLVNNLKPDTIIMIDSLATTSEERLNQCIEISDTGIIPGKALNYNREINKKTFDIPVIAIGVPLLIKNKKNFYATPDIQEVITRTSDILAGVLNSIYFS